MSPPEFTKKLVNMVLLKSTHHIGFDIAESHRNSVSTQTWLGHIGTRFASCPPRFRSNYPHANASPPHLKLHTHGTHHLNVFRRIVRPEESSELHCARRLFFEFCSTGPARLLIRPFSVPWCTTRIWSSILSSEEITCHQNTTSAPCPWSSREANPRNLDSPEARNIILWTPVRHSHHHFSPFTIQRIQHSMFVTPSVHTNQHSMIQDSML